MPELESKESAAHKKHGNNFYEHSKTSKSHRFKLDLTDKLNLKDPEKTWL